jgi:succinoglycan biosynthesis transport protein ExoP
MEQEISLREIIEIILKGKWIILIVTVIAIFISGIYSFFIVSPTYETNSLVRIQQNTSDTAKSKVDLNAFVESLKSDSSINRIIDKLKLDSNTYNINSIRNLIQLEVVKDTSVMKIKVKGGDSLLITNIANLLAYELGNRIEITEQSQTIVESQDKLEDLMEKITISKSELTEAQKQLESIPEKQVIRQRLAEDDLLKDLLKESNSSSVSDIAALQLESESLNPAYNLLQTRIAELTITLTSLQTEEQNLRAKIVMSTERINELDVQLLQEKLTAKTSDRLLSGYQAVFISPAIQPSEPVGPNKMMNIIFAVIISGMISVLFIFFSSYMRNTSKTLTSTGE